MMRKNWIYFVLLSLLSFGCSASDDSKKETAENVFTADWESLSKHNQAPEWFADAKLGIYFHWGVYSVPAFDSEWYPHFMYQSDNNKVAKHHRETYGDPKDFNYHDFVPMFTAENFNAKEWVQLFKDAGAKFSGPCAQHHDGFAMWDSEVNPWNSMDKGPKRDVTGEMNRELRANGMKLITTFHHARNLQRHKDVPEDWGKHHSHFAYNPDYASASIDPELRMMYGNIPEEQFNQYWYDQLKEVIDGYSPDIIWFDSWLNYIPEKKRQEFAAYYLNEAKKKNQEVIIAYKQTDLPSSLGIKDIEQGGKKELAESVWMTDVTLSYGSWCYTKGQTYKTADIVLRNMIDVWSKNGVVLLNVSPLADGTIPEEQKVVLHEIGDWMKTYGEAVYNTRPWDKFGYGPAKVEDGPYGGQSAVVRYTAKDVRFTCSKDRKSIYAIFLGKPEKGSKIRLDTFRGEDYPTPSPIKRMTVLGTNVDVPWVDKGNSFTITVPDAPMNDLATVIKFELE